MHTLKLMEQNELGSYELEDLLKEQQEDKIHIRDFISKFYHMFENKIWNEHTDPQSYTFIIGKDENGNLIWENVT